ncbi:hypothetical protein ACTWP8_21775 [Streptomyces sp. 7N604]
MRLELGGGLALAAHQALRRQVGDINLMTEQAHDADRVMELITSALQFVGYEVRADPVGAGGPGTYRAVQFTGPGQRHGEEPPIRLTTARMPQYNDPVQVQGLEKLPVSSMTTLAVRSLQAVRGRFDPRDFVDLTMQERHWGTRAFDKLTVQVLEREARNLPTQDPAGPFLRMHRSLARVTRMPQTGFAGFGVAAEQAEEVRSAIVAMAERVARAAPETEGPDSGVLQRLLVLPESERAAMRAWLDAQGIDAAYVGSRVPSPEQMSAARSAAVEAVQASRDRQTSASATPQQHDQAQQEGQQAAQSASRDAGYR